ncbi:unnamed protein product [Lactuca virosa]|uniref:Jacalin-like lectin domain-containing protein n=1 Tax=Lactuca virosa TaxID=75947 RepID=A0AAU9NAU1_9ASTR|nr:unnamed protein product [Lactuca virosa]
MEIAQHLKIPLEEIILATKNFDKQNFIAKGGFGSVYKGELSLFGRLIEVAVKRLEPQSDQGKHEFMMEISILSSYSHENLVSLLGFCEEGNEKLLVYKHESRGSLDNYIQNPDLTWMQRLKISIGAARGINYLHDEVGQQHRVLHRDIKSGNILLNNEWEAKVSDFGLSKIGPAHIQHTFVVTRVAGTLGYVDPSYYNTEVLTKEADVYSFGVVLFEILCGRLAYVKGSESLDVLAKSKYIDNKLDEIIIPELRKQMKLSSLNTFSAIAYQCLKPDRSERPTMAHIVEELEKAYRIQASLKTAEVIRVGSWGNTSTGGPHNCWHFILEKDHKLKKITIDHGDENIYSLTFTTESNGIFYTSERVGDKNGGGTVTEKFEENEELTGIKGTIRVLTSGHTTISSLTFITNDTTRGPFGRKTDTPFYILWEKGNFGGFYGLAHNIIDGIGVYMKSSSDGFTRVGKWGMKSQGRPDNQWSFRLQKIIV